MIDNDDPQRALEYCAAYRSVNFSPLYYRVRVIT
jgi:hypothetical protein